MHEGRGSITRGFVRPCPQQEEAPILTTYFKVKLVDKAEHVVYTRKLAHYPSEAEIARLLQEQKEAGAVEADVDKRFALAGTIVFEKPHPARYVFARYSTGKKEYCWVNVDGHDIRVGDEVLVETVFGTQKVTVCRISSSPPPHAGQLKAAVGISKPVR